MIDPLPGDIFRKGQVLNNTYEIEGVLGRGGTGEVYRARNQITGRVVAIKALNRAFSGNADYLELMKREEEMREIRHDAVVRYTDCSRSAEGHVYLVMDYVDGTPLSEAMAGGMPARDLMVVAHRVAEGLVVTHGRGIVHRDLSPDNIILRGGEAAQAVIIDFGIAKDSNAGARTIVGNDFAGKYEYAAPEQMDGRAEPRSDLYALGASLLAAFRGQVPDVGTSPGAVIRRKGQPLDVSGVPEPLRGLIADLTQPDPARRPPNAAAVVAEIERMLKPEARKAVRSRRPLWWAAAALVLAVVAGLGLWGGGIVGGLPVAAPYKLEAASDPARLSGYAPDAAGRQAIEAAFGEATRAGVPKEALVLARGAPVPDWSAAMARLIGLAAPLEGWVLAARDGDVLLTGQAPDRATRDDIAARLAALAQQAGLAGRAQIGVGPAHLSADAVAGILAPRATCGPLEQAAPTDGDYPAGSEIAVTGAVAQQADIEAIRAALQARIGDRTARLDLAVLNPELCTVQALLPQVPIGPLSIVFGNGATDSDTVTPNMAGVFAVGDHPVVDVLAPGDLAQGYLWVAVADISGKVYNLLPNQARPEQALARLGALDGAVRRIRVLYPPRETSATDYSRPGVSVDATFGKTLVLVLQTDKPLFATLRPIEELVELFAKGLREALDSGGTRVVSVTSRLIDTKQ